jgi:hypothetical protein
MLTAAAIVWLLCLAGFLCLAAFLSLAECAPVRDSKEI